MWVIVNSNTWRHLVASLILAVLLAILNGCAAVHTSVSKRNLNVQTSISDTVSLNPVSPDNRSIFVQVGSTSVKPDFGLEGPLRIAISAKGYHVIDVPEAAQFKPQAQFLSVARASVTVAEAALNDGYRGPLARMAVGAPVGVAAAGSSQNMAVAGVAGAIVGGLVETAVDAAVQDVFFVAITDVQISLKVRSRLTGQRDFQVDANQGIGGSGTKTFSEFTYEKRDRTRVAHGQQSWPEVERGRA